MSGESAQQATAVDGPAPVLTWGLLTATYNRQDVLPRAVRCAVRQDPAPLEIVIIDASDNWAQTRTLVERVLEEEGSSARLVYEEAVVRSSTHQRNQGIDRARADVLFMIDDDSLMHADCARQALAIFGHPEAGSVVGLSALLDMREPDKMPAPAQPASRPPAAPPRPRKRGLKRRVIEWFRGTYLPDYDAPPPPWDVPQSLRDSFGCFPRRRLHGCRMVLRRAALEGYRFNETLTRYAYLEDTDLGFRLGREGMILAAPRARICHLGENTGRIPSRRTAIISITNAAYLTRKHAGNFRTNLNKIRFNAIRRAPLELLRDLAAKRWGAPRFIGIWIGLMQTRWIGSVPIEQLDDRYRDYQDRLNTAG